MSLALAGRFFTTHINFSFFGISGWDTDLDWITQKFSGLPWKETKIILLFSKPEPKYCISDSFVDYEGYSISSKGFIATVVDIMVI